ncbi:ATP-dependent serine protease [Paludibacter sp. 221]|uniref:ATP-dependent serine protease n=1 Tax=Paludibacter sp. 221 TaxID=2302939 RepID=UPI0013D6CD2C|nr:ATP-dependent serine protease [Paludibacter sp. 221]NDV45482.1 ATP-dependent serine protease [Paludibacter sp. 221]
MSEVTPRKNKRALSPNEVATYKPEVLAFTGEWRGAIGLPELKGAWIVFGDSGHGKTSFALKLGKYFAQLGKRTAYDSIEEGLSLSMRDAFLRTGMSDVSGKFLLLDKEPISELKERLKKRRSPEVIIIDSVQYTNLKTKEYKELIDDFPNKLFIFISHEKNGEPKGALAQAIYYDAFVCIRVQGFIANVTKTRYGGAGEITISEQKAREYWAMAKKKEKE